MKNIQIGVIGGSFSNLPLDKVDKILKDAETVGSLIGDRQGILISGGMDGVMEASSKGASLNGGIVIGVPGRQRNQCNQYVTVEICTPIDVGDFLFAGILSCDVIIIFPGGAGTLAEIALAYRYSKPMIIMSGFDESLDQLIGKGLDNSQKMIFQGASSPQEAIDLAFKYKQEVL